MKYIVEAFSILMIMLLNLFLGLTVISVSADVAAAREYKAGVVAEVENSDFNPEVIAACKEQAALQGYTLEISPCVYEESSGRRIARVCLTYTYELPLLGVSQQRETVGIAR